MLLPLQAVRASPAPVARRMGNKGNKKRATTTASPEVCACLVPSALPPSCLRSCVLCDVPIVPMWHYGLCLSRGIYPLNPAIFLPWFVQAARRLSPLLPGDDLGKVPVPTILAFLRQVSEWLGPDVADYAPKGSCVCGHNPSLSLARCVGGWELIGADSGTPDPANDFGAALASCEFVRLVEVDEDGTMAEEWTIQIR